MIHLDRESYISKVAYDKNGKKLGKIIDARKTFDTVQQKETKEIIISKKPFWHKSVNVSLAITTVLENSPGKVIFDIAKNDFDFYVKKHVVFRKLKAKNAKLRNASSTEKAYALSFSWGKL